VRKNSKSIFLIFLLLVFAISCSKQEAPEVLPEAAWEITDRERLEACSNVNFSTDLLNHQNTIFLFKCTDWDEAFPSFYRGILNIDPVSWNHFFSPVNEVFLNDRERRDRIFDHIRDLDSKRGLDDLSRVLTALNETNFYDGLLNLFNCSENPSRKECRDRDGRHLSKKQIKDLIKLVELKPVFIKALSVLINNSMDTIGPDDEALRAEIKKFFYDDRFIKIRLKLVSSFAQKFVQGITPLEREFFKKLTITRWQGSEDPYLFHWIQQPSFTSGLFHRLTKYAVIENPELVKDVKLLKKGYHYPVYCKPYSNAAKIDIDLKTHVDEFLNYVHENDYREFHEFVIQNVASLQLALSFCPDLQKYSGDIVFVENGEVVRSTHSINFVNLEKDLVDLASEIPIFDLSKFVTFLATRNMGNIPPNPSFLLDIITEEYVEWLVELTKIVHTSTDSYFDLMFKFIKKTNKLTFDSVGVLLNESLLLENNAKIDALARSWLFLNEEEQNFLFNFIDRHLADDTNFKLLFRFYAKMLDEYAVIATHFSTSWTGNDEKLERSYNSLFDIVKNFSGKNVLSDFNNFFSRDHIITIMKVITRGPELRRVALNQLNSNLITEYITKIPSNPYELDFTNEGDEYSMQAKKCIDSMTEGQDLYSIISSFPENCSFFKNKEITLQTFSWLSNIEDNYQRFYSTRGQSNILFDNTGIMAPDVLNNSIALIRIIDENLAFRLKDTSTSGGMKYVMDVSQEHLFTENYIEDLLNVFSFSSGLADIGGAEHRYLRNKVLKELILEEGPELEEVMSWGSDLLKEYGRDVRSGVLLSKNYVENLDYSCENYTNPRIGGIPCPGRDRIKKAISSIVKDLVTKNDTNEPTALSLFLQGLVPGYGLPIPFDSKDPRLKRLTIKETFEMVYKLTDSKHDHNLLRIKFREDDEYDSLYDVENWTGTKALEKGLRKERKEKVDDFVKPEDELFFSEENVKLNTLERIEISVKDVRFDMSYLGAHYMNSVAKADDYNFMVENKLKMFERCVGIRFCGKFFSRQQIRMAKNAVAAYPGLLDANKVKEFSFGDYMQALLSTFVGSSSKTSQKSALVKVKVFGRSIQVPWVQTKNQLKKHNGKILTKVSMYAGFSHLSRVVRDRIGRTHSEFQSNLNSEKLNLINELLLHGLDPQEVEPIVEELLKSLNKKVGGQSAIDNAIDWIADLSYQEQREFEDFLVNLTYISTFLGTGVTGQGFTLNEKSSRRYEKNNVRSVLVTLKNIAPLISSFKSDWPMNFNLMKVIRLFSKPVEFISRKLPKEKNLNKNISYKLINEAFIVFRKYFGQSNSVSGSSYLSEYLKDKDRRSQIIRTLFSLEKYNSFFERSEADMNGFEVLAINMARVVKDQRFSLSNIKGYFLRSTSTRHCLSTNGTAHDCKVNGHYDEPAKLLVFANQKQGSKKTNLEILLETIFKEHINDYTSLFENLLPLIRVQLHH
jgi:hypothetical protein